MDNKKWYKRISTCFWFLLAVSPVLYCFFGIAFQWFSTIFQNEAIQYQYNNNVLLYYYNNFGQYFHNCMANLADVLPVWLFDWCEYLAEVVGFSYVVGYFVGWFFMVYVIELICDIMVFIPKFSHALLEKGVNKFD